MSNRPQKNQGTWIGLAAASMAFLVLVIAAILVFPRYIVERDLGSRNEPRSSTDFLKAQNDVRTTLLQGLAGLAVLLGAFVTFRQLRVSRQQLEATREQLQQNREQLQQNLEMSRAELHVIREGQITERFTRAIEHLGSGLDKLDIVIGGVYALERIAKDSSADRTAIIEILTAYHGGGHRV
jgi:hypothetical protein